MVISIPMIRSQGHIEFNSTTAEEWFPTPQDETQSVYHQREALVIVNRILTHCSLAPLSTDSSLEVQAQAIEALPDPLYWLPVFESMWKGTDPSEIKPFTGRIKDRISDLADPLLPAPPVVSLHVLEQKCFALLERDSWPDSKKKAFLVQRLAKRLEENDGHPAHVQFFRDWLELDNLDGPEPSSSSQNAETQADLVKIIANVRTFQKTFNLPELWAGKIPMTGRPKASQAAIRTVRTVILLLNSVPRITGILNQVAEKTSGFRSDLVKCLLVGLENSLLVDVERLRDLDPASFDTAEQVADAATLRVRDTWSTLARLHMFLFPRSSKTFDMEAAINDFTSSHARSTIEKHLLTLKFQKKTVPHIASLLDTPAKVIEIPKRTLDLKPRLYTGVCFFNNTQQESSLRWRTEATGVQEYRTSYPRRGWLERLRKLKVKHTPGWCETTGQITNRTLPIAVATLKSLRSSQKTDDSGGPARRVFKSRKLLPQTCVSDSASLSQAGATKIRRPSDRANDPTRRNCRNSLSGSKMDSPMVPHHETHRRVSSNHRPQRSKLLPRGSKIFPPESSEGNRLRSPARRLDVLPGYLQRFHSHPPPQGIPTVHVHFPSKSPLRVSGHSLRSQNFAISIRASVRPSSTQVEEHPADTSPRLYRRFHYHRSKQGDACPTSGPSSQRFDLSRVCHQHAKKSFDAKSITPSPRSRYRHQSSDPLHRGVKATEIPKSIAIHKQLQTSKISSGSFLSSRKTDILRSLLPSNQRRNQESPDRKRDSNSKESKTIQRLLQGCLSQKIGQTVNSGTPRPERARSFPLHMEWRDALQSTDRRYLHRRVSMGLWRSQPDSEKVNSGFVATPCDNKESARRIRASAATISSGSDPIVPRQSLLNAIRSLDHARRSARSVSNTRKMGPLFKGALRELVHRQSSRCRMSPRKQDKGSPSCTRDPVHFRNLLPAFNSNHPYLDRYKREQDGGRTFQTTTITNRREIRFQKAIQNSAFTQLVGRSQASASQRNYRLSWENAEKTASTKGFAFQPHDPVFWTNLLDAWQDDAINAITLKNRFANLRAFCPLKGYNLKSLSPETFDLINQITSRLDKLGKIDADSKPRKPIAPLQLAASIKNFLSTRKVVWDISSLQMLSTSLETLSFRDFSSILLCILMYATGSRSSDIRAIAAESLVFDQLGDDVPESLSLECYSVKTSQTRLVSKNTLPRLDRRTLRLLPTGNFLCPVMWTKAFVEKFPTEQRFFLFESKPKSPNLADPSPLSAQAVSYRVTKIIGHLEGISTHSLRIANASYANSARYPVDLIKNWIGWSANSNMHTEYIRSVPLAGPKYVDPTQNTAAINNYVASIGM